MIKKKLTLFMYIFIVHVYYYYIFIYLLLKYCGIFPASAPAPKEGDPGYKDWVFINYTFRRFESLLTQMGVKQSKRT